ncbi:hypothetical protein LAZ67_18001840 [Cordylochernes scorpioides]|uniref:Uncharacterized protein n=1 Tax=Cordylochernes scorpioides TaxID=51811 RepID=A0ABY6LG41_9ARAC|nr:hypothetical protein LAZ67_18001840 [Cordylochernes scorpioides]
MQRQDGRCRPRATTERDDRAIVRMAVAAPESTLSTIQRVTDTQVSKMTINKRLKERNLRARRPLRCLPSHPCTDKSDYSVFSDESRFLLCPDDRRKRVWKRPGQRVDPGLTVEHHTGPQQGVMVWGAISFDSRTPLVVLPGTTHIWDVMGRRLQPSRNVDYLTRQLETIWQDIWQHTIRNLYQSMTRRVAVCIQARRHHGCKICPLILEAKTQGIDHYGFTAARSGFRLLVSEAALARAKAIDQEGITAVRFGRCQYFLTEGRTYLVTAEVILVEKPLNTSWQSRTYLVTRSYKSRETPHTSGPRPDVFDNAESRQDKEMELNQDPIGVKSDGPTETTERRQEVRESEQAGERQEVTGRETTAPLADAVNQLSALLTRVKISDGAESTIPPFDGTYNATQFFQAFDRKMEDASIGEQEKLLRLPNYLVRQPLELFRKLRMADRSYFQLTGQANLETYYREKTAMGLQLGLPQEVIPRDADRRTAIQRPAPSPRSTSRGPRRVVPTGTADPRAQSHPDAQVHGMHLFRRPTASSAARGTGTANADIEQSRAPSQPTQVKTSQPSSPFETKWLKEIKAPSGRLFRWRLRLSRYEYEVRSINGVQQYETGVVTRIPFCGFLDAPLIKSQQSSPPGKSRVTMDHNKLRTVSRKGVLKTIVPSSLTTRLLKSVHTQHHHPNISKMTRLISSQYYWQNMTQDIAKQVKTCPICRFARRIDEYNQPSRKNTDTGPKAKQNSYIKHSVHTTQTMPKLHHPRQRNNHTAQPKSITTDISLIKPLTIKQENCEPTNHLNSTINKKRPEKWHQKNWLLHHDNARPHTAVTVQLYLAKHGIASLPQPPYSPDPNDFFL